jgi:hypothetical protein
MPTRETLSLPVAAERTRATLPAFAAALDLICKVGTRSRRHPLVVSCYAGTVYSLETPGMSMGSGAVEGMAASMQTPAIGSPAVYHIGSDRYAGTIEYVSPSGKTIRIKTPLGHETARRAGVFGQYRCSNGGGVTTNDNRPDYRDPSF